MNTKLLKIVGVLLGIVLVYALVVVGSNAFHRTGNGTVATQAELEMWSVFDTSDDMQPILTDLRNKYGIKVNYRSFTDMAEYRETLLRELASGQGPDIFAMHNTWLPKYRALATPLPEEQLGFTPEKVRKQFVDTVAVDFIRPSENKTNARRFESVDQIFGLPQYVDSLALWYNADIFKRVLEKPFARPEPTWAGAKRDAAGLSVPDADDDEGFRLTGIAAGRADNISRGKELFYTLFLQYGGSQATSDAAYPQVASSGRVRTGNAGTSALDFLSRFTRDAELPEYSWNAEMGQGAPEMEIDAFVRGKVASIAGYSYYYDLIAKSVHQYQRKNITGLVDLSDVAAAPIPQLSDPASGDPKVALADYFALSVAQSSKYPTQAWQAILYLTGREAVSKYAEATGRPASRRDVLVGQQQQDGPVATFARQAVYAETLKMADPDKFHAAVAEVMTRVADGTVQPRAGIATLDRYLKCLEQNKGSCVLGG